MTKYVQIFKLKEGQRNFMQILKFFWPILGKLCHLEFGLWITIKQMLSELINFYSLWNHQKTYGLLMISGGIKVN